jgi:predicted DNA-binding ribbon-helix-helix protein
VTLITVAVERAVLFAISQSFEPRNASRRAHVELAVNSTVKKRSIVVDRHRTSVSLEDNFWACLRQIARERATTLSKLIGMLDAERNGGNLSSTIRVFVLDHHRNNVASNQILPANEEGRNLPARQPSRSGLLLERN